MRLESRLKRKVQSCQPYSCQTIFTDLHSLPPSPQFSVPKKNVKEIKKIINQTKSKEIKKEINFVKLNTSNLHKAVLPWTKSAKDLKLLIYQNRAVRSLHNSFDAGNMPRPT